jgi:L-arabonate dehydrase
MKNQGYPHDLFDGKPVIGICNTWSELTPCNAHFRELAEHRQARRLRGGRLPARVPGHVARRDAAAAHRHAVPQPRARMDVEESIRGNPIDGVVLLMGCDKTTPALLMGAASSTCRPSASRAGRCSTASSAARTSARAPASGR